jgi:predicted O-linked N-acetylglucosamine transferase (SPINDLY family)
MRAVVPPFSVMSIHNEFDRALRLHRDGKLREAFFRYDAILKAEPAHAGALHYSGVVLYQSGRLADAAERIRAAIAIQPAQPDAWSNLALVLDAARRREAAANALREAARYAPQSAQVWSNLAATEAALGRFGEAEAAARQALAAEPHEAAGWYNLAQSLAPQGRALEALDAASRAAGSATARPEYAGYKAQLQDEMGAPEQAQATLETALARFPGHATLRVQLAGLLDRRGMWDEAAQAYQNVLGLEPGSGAALSQLLFLRQRVADWRDVPDLRRRFRDGVTKGVPLLSPFVLLGNDSSRALQRRCAEAWSDVLAPLDAATPPRALSSGKLRLGYLSADFHSHATAFLAAGLFAAHDRARFEVVAYSTGPDDGSPMRRRLVEGFDRFVDAQGWAPGRLAAGIRGDGIDILVDLKGHTEGAAPSVLALRPAPIQVHYLGYPGTIGGGLCDYLIGDPIVTPPAHAADYAETLALLPHSYQVNDRARPVHAPPPREDLELPRDAVVLCCFNNLYKLNAEVFDAWARILAAVPNAVLWLLVRDAAHPGIGRLRREAVRRGIDARRLVFATARPNPDYLGLYRHADLFLDTWPYNAHTTASDALWAGCPVLTWRGEAFAGRVAASLLHAVGLPELVADSVDDYVTRAIALAGDAGERSRLRAHLEGAGRASPLFDTQATARALEAAYEAMAEQQRRGVREPIRIA